MCMTHLAVFPPTSSQGCYQPHMNDAIAPEMCLSSGTRAEEEVLVCGGNTEE